MAFETLGQNAEPEARTEVDRERTDDNAVQRPQHFVQELRKQAEEKEQTEDTEKAEKALNAEIGTNDPPRVMQGLPDDVVKTITAEKQVTEELHSAVEWLSALRQQLEKQYGSRLNVRLDGTNTLVMSNGAHSLSYTIRRDGQVVLIDSTRVRPNDAFPPCATAFWRDVANNEGDGFAHWTGSMIADVVQSAEAQAKTDAREAPGADSPERQRYDKALTQLQMTAHSMSEDAFHRSRRNGQNSVGSHLRELTTAIAAMSAQERTALVSPVELTDNRGVTFNCYFGVSAHANTIEYTFNRPTPAEIRTLLTDLREGLASPYRMPANAVPAGGNINVSSLVSRTMARLQMHLSGLTASERADFDIAAERSNGGVKRTASRREARASNWSAPAQVAGN